MKLTFSWSELTRAFEEIDSAKTARELYGSDTGKGLWLVGDDGVYLMPNTADGIHHKDGGERVVVYARECNPKTMSFDEWWSAKQSSFGGDDGVEFIDAAELRTLAKAASPHPDHLEIDFRDGSLRIAVLGASDK
jgi:hypothetical protein